MTLRIDMHSHFFPTISREEAERVDQPDVPWLAVSDDGESGMIMLGDRAFRPVERPLWDPRRRIEQMDEQGIDVQLMCATPVMFGYRYAASTALQWTQRMNDKALELCSAAPNRLMPLAQVPLQDTESACGKHPVRFPKDIAVFRSVITLAPGIWMTKGWSSFYAIAQVKEFRCSCTRGT